MSLRMLMPSIAISGSGKAALHSLHAMLLDHPRHGQPLCSRGKSSGDQAYLKRCGVDLEYLTQHISTISQLETQPCVELLQETHLFGAQDTFGCACRDVWAGPKEPVTNYILVALFCLGE